MNFLTRYEELGESFEPKQIQVRRALRVNTLKMKEEELVKRLRDKKVKLEKIPFLTHGYYYTSDFSLGSTPEYLQGYYYLQEAASQLPVEVLNPSQKDLVLDMAASPGSKTTQIAQWMKNKGKIIALDNDINRLKSLQNNLERLSITNTIIIKKDARYASDLELKFDKILLDAPCSGNFCIEPGYFLKRALSDILLKSKTQKELLKSAIENLKPEGIIVYSTCSLEPEENELVIDWALGVYPEMDLEKIDLSIGSEGLTTVFGKKIDPRISRTARFWPHKTGTEGFFIAKLIKRNTQKR